MRKSHAKLQFPPLYYKRITTQLLRKKVVKPFLHRYNFFEWDVKTAKSLASPTQPKSPPHPLLLRALPLFSCATIQLQSILYL